MGFVAVHAQRRDGDECAERGGVTGGVAGLAISGDDRPSLRPI